MDGTLESWGTFEEQEDAATLRFERVYPRPIETVWSAMTQPERLADWLGVSELEPRVGGAVRLFTDGEPAAQVHGRVLAWEPPRVLAFTWAAHDEPETVVRAELSEAGEGATRLVFTHAGVPRKWLALTLPGWHQLLERLGVLLLEDRVLPDGMERWRELQSDYLQRYDLSGADVDPPLPPEAYESPSR